MALLAVLVLALGLFCRLGVQQEIDTTYTQGKNGVFWIFPTEFQTFNTLDVVNVTWRSPFKNPKLFTFCIDNDVVKQRRPFLFLFSLSPPSWIYHWLRPVDRERIALMRCNQTQKRRRMQTTPATAGSW